MMVIRYAAIKKTEWSIEPPKENRKRISCYHLSKKRLTQFN